MCCGADIHQHPPASSLSPTQVTDNNGSAAPASEMRRGNSSFDKGENNRWLLEILQLWTQMTARVSVTCEQVHGCVELHYTSAISPSLGPGHSSVPRHKGELMKLPSVEGK